MASDRKARSAGRDQYALKLEKLIHGKQDEVTLLQVKITGHPAASPPAQAQPQPHDTGGGGPELGLLRQRVPPVPGQPEIAAQPAVMRYLPVGLDQPVGGEPRNGQQTGRTGPRPARR